MNTPGSHSPHGDRNEFRSTLSWQRASRATRRIGIMVNVSEKCYMLNLHHVPSALVATERGRDACAPRLAGGTPAYPAYKGRFLGKPLYTISRFSHQNAQTLPSPLVGVQGRTEHLSKDAFSGVAMGNPPSPPTPLPHCERGANLKQVYRVVMLSEAWITHIFCPLLNLWEKGVRGMRGKDARECRAYLSQKLYT